MYISNLLMIHVLLFRFVSYRNKYDM